MLWCSKVLKTEVEYGWEERVACRRVREQENDDVEPVMEKSPGDTEWYILLTEDTDQECSDNKEWI